VIVVGGLGRAGFGAGFGALPRRGDQQVGGGIPIDAAGDDGGTEEVTGLRGLSGHSSSPTRSGDIAGPGPLPSNAPQAT
jgi:hypothetical protein